LIAEADEAAHQVAVARDHAAAPPLEITERAKAVVFEIKEPLRIVEWVRPSDRDDGLDARQHPRQPRSSSSHATAMHARATTSQRCMGGRDDGARLDSCNGGDVIRVLSV